MPQSSGTSISYFLIFNALLALDTSVSTLHFYVISSTVHGILTLPASHKKPSSLNVSHHRTFYRRHNASRYMADESIWHFVYIVADTKVIGTLVVALFAFVFLLEYPQSTSSSAGSAFPYVIARTSQSMLSFSTLTRSVHSTFLRCGFQQPTHLAILTRNTRSIWRTSAMAFKIQLQAATDEKLVKKCEKKIYCFSSFFGIERNER